MVLPLFFLIFLMCLSHFIIDFMLSIWPVYKTIAHIDLAAAGLLLAAAVLIGELMQLIFGKLIDKGHFRILLILGPLLGSVAVLFPYVGSYPLFLLLIIGTCIGSAAIHPSAVSVLGGLDIKRKALLMGCFQTAGNLGMGVGQLSFSWVYEQVAGHTAVLFIPAILLSLLLLISRKKLPYAPAQNKEHVSLKLIFKFFQSKPLRCLYMVQLTSQTVLWSLVFLLPDFLVSRHHSEWVCLGGGHLVLMLGAAATAILSGLIGDKLTPAKTILGSFVLVCIAFYTFIAIPTIPTAGLLSLLFVVGGLLGSISPLALVMGNALVPSHRGMISAFLMGLVWILSEGLGIGMSGVIADLFTEDAPANALACLGSALFIGTFFAFKLVPYQSEKFSLETA
jgi:MFS transporter, FSR family, fosmidomycin resistance protein